MTESEMRDELTAIGGAVMQHFLVPVVVIPEAAYYKLRASLVPDMWCADTPSGKVFCFDRGAAEIMRDVGYTVTAYCKVSP